MNHRTSYEHVIQLSLSRTQLQLMFSSKPSAGPQSPTSYRKEVNISMNGSIVQLVDDYALSGGRRAGHRGGGSEDAGDEGGEDGEDGFDSELHGAEILRLRVSVKQPWW